MTDRRLFLTSVGSALFTTRGLFAEMLAATPELTEGPFYPDRLPLDKDNDLLIVGDHITPAVGQVTRLSGTVRSASGSPVRNATVEIWQADHSGIYLNSRSQRVRKIDPNFQGYGRFETGAKGEYAFRTIKPVPYDNRCPHIHVRVKQGEREMLTTQVFMRGDPLNAQDGVLRGLRDPMERELVVVEFRPVANSPVTELRAQFDIVLGRTPEHV